MSDKNTTPKKKDGLLDRHPELAAGLWMAIPLLLLVVVTIIVKSFG